MAKYNRKWNNPADRSEYSGLYRSWCDMHRRSENKIKTKPTYSDVTVCERWLSYDNFFEDMHETWFKGATLDKDIIKPGNHIYCKEYCKWVTKSENSKERNTRLGPSMLNIEIAKNHSVKMKGNSCRAKKVQCIETQEIFKSCRDAANKYNLRIDAVSRAANPNDKQHNTTGGYHWKYIEEVK